MTAIIETNHIVKTTHLLCHLFQSFNVNNFDVFNVDKAKASYSISDLSRLKTDTKWVYLFEGDRRWSLIVDIETNHAFSNSGRNYIWNWAQIWTVMTVVGWL